MVLKNSILAIIAVLSLALASAGESKAATLTLEMTGRVLGVGPLPGTDFSIADPDLDDAPSGGVMLSVYSSGSPVVEPFNFGTVFAETAVFLSFDLQNTGTGEAAFNSISMFSGQYFILGPANLGAQGSLPASDCGATLAVGSNCSITVAWFPSDFSMPTGTYNDFLVVDYDSVTAVPVPAAFPLFVAALGLLGMVVGGRKLSR